MSTHLSASVDGTCSPAFDRVRNAFEANFWQRDEIGASVAVWVDGQLVVNPGVAPPTTKANDPGDTTPSSASSPAQKP